MASQFTLFHARLGNDPEVKGERSLFRVAEKLPPAKGETEGGTRWYSVFYFDKNIGKHIGTGCRVSIVGTLKDEDFNGKRSYTIFADKVHICDFKDKNKDKNEGKSDTDPPQADDEIPF